MALVLASQSPRRRQLMALITPDFAVDEALVDEAGATAPSPLLLVEALADLKAQAVFARRPHDVVIGCDTVVEVEGQTMGKPRNEAEALKMVGFLSGRRHRVHTGVCVCRPGGMPPLRFVETTAIEVAQVPPKEIQAYVKTAEPYDKAGGYGIQGWAARFITRVEGCYYNVMGLPVARLYATLCECGVLPSQ